MTAPGGGERVPPAPQGWGALLTTDVSHHDLGTHHGQTLRGRVRRRTLHLGIGTLGAFAPRRGQHHRRWRIELGRTRPVAVEVTDRDGHRYDVAIPTPPDPWPRAGMRVLLWGSVATIITMTIRRRRTTRS